MKLKIGAAILMLLTGWAAAESNALTQIKRSPEVICADNSNPGQCQETVKALIYAINNIASLNATCESNKELRQHMNQQLKYQCDSAKEISEYAKHLQ
ncbi:hypothetical protein SMY33_003644 [Cronobacter malonaticus]|nr:hypothetical protein [Cronobacter malonaticus]